MGAYRNAMTNHFKKEHSNDYKKKSKSKGFVSVGFMGSLKPVEADEKSNGTNNPKGPLEPANFEENPKSPVSLDDIINSLESIDSDDQSNGTDRLMGSLEEIDFGDKGNETNNFMGTLEAIDFEDNSRSPVNMGYTGSLEPINYEDTSNGNSRIQDAHTGYHVDKNVDTSYVEASYMWSRNIGEDFMNYKEK